MFGGVHIWYIKSIHNTSVLTEEVRRIRLQQVATPSSSRRWPCVAVCAWQQRVRCRRPENPRRKMKKIIRDRRRTTPIFKCVARARARARVCVSVRTSACVCAGKYISRLGGAGDAATAVRFLEPLDAKNAAADADDDHTHAARARPWTGAGPR